MAKNNTNSSRYIDKRVIDGLALYIVFLSIIFIFGCMSKIIISIVGIEYYTGPFYILLILISLVLYYELMCCPIFGYGLWCLLNIGDCFGR